MKAKNENNVPKKQWNKWSELGREAFNEVYGGALMDERDTRVVAWNSAWLAADILCEMEKNLRLLATAVLELNDSWDQALSEATSEAIQYARQITTI